MDDRTREFLNVMHAINTKAKNLGYTNGRNWAENSGVLSANDVEEFVLLHHLRNGIAHGRSKDIYPSQETVDFTKAVLAKIQQDNQPANASGTREFSSYKPYNKPEKYPPYEKKSYPQKPADHCSKPAPQPGTLEWYLQNAKKGDLAAQSELGRRYATGEDVTEDKKKAADWYRKAAEQGHAKAQFQLAELLYFSGCSSYRGEAVAWYRKAAEQGLPEAQCAAGIFDPANKFKWLEKASEQGYAPASQSLGGIYLQYAKLSKANSVSYSNNISEALTWFLKAVEQGDSDSAFFVGECYNMQGDKSEALKWFSKYVELSDSYSTVRVGESFFRQGDKAEALKWYLKSVELGETAAIPAIPMIYEELGNAAEAVKWYLKAAEGGSKTAAERLKKLQADE